MADALAPGSTLAISGRPPSIESHSTYAGARWQRHVQRHRRRVVAPAATGRGQARLPSPRWRCSLPVPTPSSSAARRYGSGCGLLWIDLVARDDDVEGRECASAGGDVLGHPADRHGDHRDPHAGAVQVAEQIAARRHATAPRLCDLLEHPVGEALRRSRPREVHPPRWKTCAECQRPAPTRARPSSALQVPPAGAHELGLGRAASTARCRRGCRPCPTGRQLAVRSRDPSLLGPRSLILV